MGGSGGATVFLFLHCVQAVQCDAPFEGGREEHGAQRLQQQGRPPLLVPSDPQDSESEVVVHADDVREDVVSVIMGVPPLRRETGRVPLPGIGVDFRVVHPIPLTVADVMAKFHILDALGRGESGGSHGPAKLAFALGDGQPRRDFKAALKTDSAHDVGTVLGAPRNLDIAADLV